VGLGFGSMASYLAQRRAAGWTWRAMSAESGQPESWLRRQAGGLSSGAPSAGRAPALAWPG
jgi:hypothetical protein